MAHSSCLHLLAMLHCGCSCRPQAAGSASLPHPACLPLLRFGAKGVFAASAVIFFSYVGFDYVSHRWLGQISMELHYARDCSASVAHAKSIGGALALHALLPTAACTHASQCPTPAGTGLSPCPTQVANAAEEAKNPARDLPWGIVGSLGIATVLYVLMSLCIVSGWGWLLSALPAGCWRVMGAALRCPPALERFGTKMPGGGMNTCRLHMGLKPR